MHTESEVRQENRVERMVITPLLIIASLYSIYLVIHPFTPLSKLSIGILDLTQMQRATHVFFLLITGYLLASQRSPGRPGVGAFIFAAMASFPLYSFWQIGLPLQVNLPAASRGASLAQLELKLRRPLRYMSMMLDIFFNNFTSHAVSDRPRKISVLPQFPCPQLPLQHRERSEQLPRGYTFDDSHHFAYGISRWKG